MLDFDLNQISNEYEKNNVTNLLLQLEDIVVQTNEPLEGNAFYIHGSLQLYPELYTKQLNLFWCGKYAKSRICEIGFNAGHSAMLMLLPQSNNTNFEFTVFDINFHKYTKFCFNYIQKQFPNITFQFIEGDSTITVPQYAIGLYDVVHIDGGHSEYCIQQDIFNANNITRVGGLIIIDDTGIDYINNQVNLYINSGNYIELNILQTFDYIHRIIQKIK